MYTPLVIAIVPGGATDTTFTPCVANIPLPSCASALTVISPPVLPAVIKPVAELMVVPVAVEAVMLQNTVGLVALDGVTVAVSCKICPAFTLLPPLMVMPVTGRLVVCTVMVLVADLPLPSCASARMVTEPAVTPVKVPVSISILAEPVPLVTNQRTVLLLALAGLTSASNEMEAPSATVALPMMLSPLRGSHPLPPSSVPIPRCRPWRWHKHTRYRALRRSVYHPGGR